MKTRQWYQARIRWAEMVEGRGIRHWEGGLYLFRSEDRDAAFQRALEIGEGGQSGGDEESARRTRWVETRLAEVVTLDCLGDELEENLWRCTGFGCRRRRGFLLTTNSSLPSRRRRHRGDGPAVRIFGEGPGRRFALSARPTASQGFAAAGTLPKNGGGISERSGLAAIRRIKKGRLRQQAEQGPGGAK